MNQRLAFIAKINESEASLSALCREFGISRKTGYKWIERYETLGPAGLEERAPVVHAHPFEVVGARLEAILALRKEHVTWGPKKLHAWLRDHTELEVPAVSTIGEVIKRYGLVRPRRRRVRVPRHLEPLRTSEAPNDLWCIDFKGHFALGDKTRCHPLTLTDHESRYLLQCEGLTDTRGPAVRACMERAFQEFGVPESIRSDNGAPFATSTIAGLSALSVWWMKLGIRHERIEPGEPQQNGRHERMHRTLKQETASPPKASLSAQQLAFDRFRHEFNDVRPHEALDQKPPSSRYACSRRPMPSKLIAPEYPSSMKTRQLDDRGRFVVANKSIKVTRLLGGERVGLELCDEDRYRLYYGELLLGELVTRSKEVKLVHVQRVTT